MGSTRPLIGSQKAALVRVWDAALSMLGRHEDLTVEFHGDEFWLAFFHVEYGLSGVGTLRADLDKLPTSEELTKALQEARDSFHEMQALHNDALNTPKDDDKTWNHV